MKRENTGNFLNKGKKTAGKCYMRRILVSKDTNQKLVRYGFVTPVSHFEGGLVYLAVLLLGRRSQAPFLPGEKKGASVLLWN